MKRQKTITVNGKKICIKASIRNRGFTVLVDINGTKKALSAYIMAKDDYDETWNERFIKKAMEMAYVEYVKREYGENIDRFEETKYES